MRVGPVPAPIQVVAVWSSNELHAVALRAGGARDMGPARSSSLPAVVPQSLKSQRKNFSMNKLKFAQVPKFVGQSGVITPSPHTHASLLPHTRDIQAIPPPPP